MDLLRKPEVDVFCLPVALEEVTVKRSLLNCCSVELVSGSKCILEVGVAVDEPLESRLLPISGGLRQGIDDIDGWDSSERDIDGELRHCQQCSGYSVGHCSLLEAHPLELHGRGQLHGLFGRSTRRIGQLNGLF